MAETGEGEYDEELADYEEDQQEESSTAAAAAGGSG